MAARFAAGDDSLGRIVRERQDALNNWQRLDGVLIKAAGEPPERRNEANEKRLKTELAAVDERIKILDETLAQEFPAYQELANPKPVALLDLQALLTPNEALLAYLVDSDDSYLWVVRQDNFAMLKLGVGQAELADSVKALRQRLDPSDIETLADIRAFPIKQAHVLYEQVFAPALPLLEGVEHLMIVADGPLVSLPFGVLVTEAPEHGVIRLEDHRKVPWLAKRYAMTTLPSATSLKALRQFAKASPAPEPFIGFGDPVLEGPDGGATKGIKVAKLFSRGAVADVDEVRKLPGLPETADELRAMAKALAAPDSVIHLRDQATETRVKALDLSSFRVVAFSTHGLMAGDMAELAEPALVLTPPENGTTQDDGLLTASEVAQLKLNADWVLLSACNTAAPDGTPGAEGLSGLAKAFFYAGSRALLVSHWPVASEATVGLTTGIFAELSDHPEIGRAEALRRSMMAMMNDNDKPYYAHPMFWAPFVVVGEGGTLH